jgi:hypothetical protein
MILVLLFFIINDIRKFVQTPSCTLYSLLAGIIPLMYLIAMLSLSCVSQNPTDLNIEQCGIFDALNPKGWHGSSDQEKRTVVNAGVASWGKIAESLPRISLENSWRGKVVVSVAVLSEVLNRTLLDPVEQDTGTQ